MMLEKYIKDLLFRYDCVIVPNFGAFIANQKSAKVEGNKFFPPFKQITFNSLIQNNDGLLANHIALTDKMPYETALNFIKFEVEEWIDKLLDEELFLDGIGNFFLINDVLQFEPDNSINFLTSSFGLSNFISDSVKRTSVIESSKHIHISNSREDYLSQVASIEEKAPIYIQDKKRRKTSYFLKYAAIFVLGTAIVGLLGKKMHDENLEKKQSIAIQEQQKVRENEIQTATFVIASPLPTISIKASERSLKYHIIAGAFRNKQNAQSKVNQLIKKGFNASIVGQNNWHLTQVAFQSFTSLERANQALVKIKKETAKDAWLLVKEIENK